ncbi:MULTISPECIES: hypothetical protein [unclassified Streptomyces]|uniref:hypothetical protein n=1 Tax=unclassified Streptomyces TaxID=2593676 RepID=UPI001660854C|nr:MULTISPECIES: hypothetical protein [unclassified Streptomyces]MBD0709996.1 hypothetical protein [Streptomyces sp. CBMA291]MBD0713814.1 hypothetical protein [Streptomyces sp. CBMA370]
MSTAPAHGPRDAKRSDVASRPGNSPKPALVFDDPLDQQSADDTDRGWGERPPVGGDSAADLARFLDEKPPHHL